MAQQEKHSPTEKPILLSKDIEAKLALLDREVNYLLNKAKFAKPKVKAKAKNDTSSEKNGKANDTAEDKVIPPSEESTDTKSGTSHSPTGSCLLCQCEKELKKYNIPSIYSSSIFFVFLNAESAEEVPPEEAPPTDQSSVDADSDNQSQPTEEATTTGRSSKPVASDEGEL